MFALGLSQSLKFISDSSEFLHIAILLLSKNFAIT